MGPLLSRDHPLTFHGFLKPMCEVVFLQHCSARCSLPVQVIFSIQKGCTKTCILQRVRICPSNPPRGATYNILNQNTYFWSEGCQVMTESKALSIYHPTKTPAYRVSLIKLDWTPLVIAGFSLFKGFGGLKNLAAFKRHNVYGFLLKVVINSYIINLKVS